MTRKRKSIYARVTHMISIYLAIYLAISLTTVSSVFLRDLKHNSQLTGAISTILLFIGFSGIILGITGLFKLDPRDIQFQSIYDEKVQQISDCLLLVSGAFLLNFVW